MIDGGRHWRRAKSEIDCTAGRHATSIRVAQRRRNKVHSTAKANAKPERARWVQVVCVPEREFSDVCAVNP